MGERLLCLDIGSGTQDVLYYMDDRDLLNCPKFVLPSPAKQVADKICACTAKSRHVFLHGGNMGGGFFGALRKHLSAGLSVASTRAAAYSLGDNLDRVQGMGITLSEICPQDHVPIHCADYDSGFWNAFLGAAGLPLPTGVLACAQDHGFHPDSSNRIGRFTIWRELLHEHDGALSALMFDVVPPELTRLQELQSSTAGMVADTGAAAVLGALFEPEIEDLSERQGICLVNIGNSHVIAFLLFQGRIWGVYEQHTGIVSADDLWNDLALFRTGKLCFDDVFNARGHGCLTLDLPENAKGFVPTFVMGPQRGLLADMAREHEISFPNPGGDMMLAGCFGLLKGLRVKNG